MNKKYIFGFLFAVVIIIIAGLLYLYRQKSILPIEPIEPIDVPNLDLINLNNQLDINQPDPGLDTSNIPGQNIYLNSNQVEPISETVSIANFAFNPGTLLVKAGTKVTWINDDPAPHQISSQLFNSQTLNTGDKFSYIFNQAGTYDYYCSTHPAMKGVITVQ